MRVSIFTPKAFSMRSAMSPDRSALPLSRLDSAGRETRRAAAAAVTDKPAGWMISVRMKSPGWDGFFIGIAFAPYCPSDSLPVYVVDFAPCDVDAERQMAVTGDAEAPCALAAAGQCMHLPRREQT